MVCEIPLLCIFPFVTQMALPEWADIGAVLEAETVTDAAGCLPNVQSTSLPPEP